MAISKKIIGIYKKKIYNAEVPLQTIQENHILHIHNHNSLRIKNKKLKNTIYWLVFMLFAYYFFNY